MLETIREGVASVASTFRAWWGELLPKERRVAAAIAGGAVIVFAGGMVLEAALIGFMTNCFFWWGFGNHKPFVKFMQRWGVKVDIALTFGVMFISGAHAMLAGLFIAGFFSVARRVFIPADEISAEKVAIQVTKEDANV